MSQNSPYSIRLTEAEQSELSRRAHTYTLPYGTVLRAKMILLAAQGLSNCDIAKQLDTPRKVVSMWRKRFYMEGLSGLDERLRPGRPSSNNNGYDNAG